MLYMIDVYIHYSEVGPGVWGFGGCEEGAGGDGGS